jgi:hypothetical protein
MITGDQIDHLFLFLVGSFLITYLFAYATVKIREKKERKRRGAMPQYYWAGTKWVPFKNGDFLMYAT